MDYLRSAKGYSFHMCFRYGPDSDEVKAKIRQMDDLVGNLLDELEKANLLTEVNIIITSDHGMANSPVDQGIYLNRYIDFDNDTDFSYIGAVGLILPKEGKLEQVSAITGFKLIFFLVNSSSKNMLALNNEIARRISLLK